MSDIQINQNTVEWHDGYVSTGQLDMHWGHSDYGRNTKDQVVSTIETKSKAYIKGYQGGEYS